METTTTENVPDITVKGDTLRLSKVTEAVINACHLSGEQLQEASKYNLDQDLPIVPAMILEVRLPIDPGRIMVANATYYLEKGPNGPTIRLFKCEIKPYTKPPSPGGSF